MRHWNGNSTFAYFYKCLYVLTFQVAQSIVILYIAHIRKYYISRVLFVSYRVEKILYYPKGEVE